MTAGLVMVIWGVAEGQLRSMLTSALSLGEVGAGRPLPAGTSGVRPSSTSCW